MSSSQILAHGLIDTQKIQWTLCRPDVNNKSYKHPIFLIILNSNLINRRTETQNKNTVYNPPHHSFHGFPRYLVTDQFYVLFFCLFSANDPTPCNKPKISFKKPQEPFLKRLSIPNNNPTHILTTQSRMLSDYKPHCNIRAFRYHFFNCFPTPNSPLLAYRALHTVAE